MENRFQHTINGQSVLQADLNVMGEAASLADDRVFAELFRMQPYDGSTVRKGILPAGHAGNAYAVNFLVRSNAGGARVNPFRAFVGTRTAVAGDPKKNWRDIRSAIAVGATTLETNVQFSANASGSPRWDLIYAAVAVDASTASVTRKVKNPTTKVVAGQSIVTQLATTVTLDVQQGTPAASPSWPALPTDAAGVYYIPIAYVRIANGFNALSNFLMMDLAVVAPTLKFAHGAKVEPADSLYTAGGAALTAARIQAWGNTGVRPDFFLPPTAVGGSSLLVALDLRTGNLSHPADSVVDSRDWRGRVCRWTAMAGSASMQFAWNADASASTTPSFQTTPTPLVQTFAGATNDVLVGMASPRGSGVADDLVAYVEGSKLQHMSDAATVTLYADSTTGALKYRSTGAPNCKLFVWIDFSAPIDGYL